MNISDATIREVAAVSEANHRAWAEETERTAAREAVAERVSRDAIYAYTCGLPLASSIKAAVLIALEEETP